MSLNPKKIRVLVVDDSLFMRTLLVNIMEAYDDIEVIGTAKDGYEAIEKVHLLRPDLITLDVDMPRLDGLTTLGYIMSECPTPVIMVSAVVGRNSEATMKALDYGAVDFIAKPTGQISLNIRTVEDELITKIRTAAAVDLKKLPFVLTRKERIAPKPVARISQTDFPLVLIGASTGGPRAVAYLMQNLPTSCVTAAFLVIQHMPNGFTTHFSTRLNKISFLDIREAEDGDYLVPGVALIAPAGQHLMVQRDDMNLVTRFNDGPREHGVKPSLSVTMRSIIRMRYSRLLCVILTGMGSDGADSCRAIKKIGGTIIVQNEASSVVFGMPGAAIKTGMVDEVLPLTDIPHRIGDLI